MTVKKEEYNFQNIYIITTYRCNWKCNFCLFRYNNEPEADNSIIIKRLKYAISNSDKKVYIKITGGEPFLKQDLLKDIFNVANNNDKVYKIGIGTNGSIPLNPCFNNIDKNINIFLSRHTTNLDMLTPYQLSKLVHNNLIDFRINCNLIKNGIDSLAGIKKYIKIMYDHTNITHYCFRELSKVNIDKNHIYPSEIYKYIKYYDKSHINMNDIINNAIRDNQFILSRKTGNYYDTNTWFWFDMDGVKISVKFRSIDEEKLIDYNTKILPYDVDEYVIHPDGTLTGCWDKDLKLIIKKEG